MMRWSRPEVSRDIVGMKWVKYCTTFVHRLKKPVTIIKGLPVCPECGTVLDRRFTSSTWVCWECGTVWSDADLVTAIDTEDRLVGATVTVRNLED